MLTESTKTIDSHLSSADLERLNGVFSDALLSNDIQAIYYGALRGKELHKQHSELCPRVTQLHKDSKLNVSPLMIRPAERTLIAIPPPPISAGL